MRHFSRVSIPQSQSVYVVVRDEEGRDLLHEEVDVDIEVQGGEINVVVTVKSNQEEENNDAD